MKETAEVLKSSEVSPSKTSKVLKTSDVLSPQTCSKKLTPLRKGGKDFFISYATSISKSCGRKGNLFQAKFRKKQITDEAYYTTIIQYTHSNPVKARPWLFKMLNQRLA